MSLSLIRRLSAPSALAGIAVGHSRICAAVLGPQPGKHQMHSLEERDLAEPLFSGPPSATARAALAQAFREMTAGFRDEFAALSVALPDTVIRSSVFELDELPKSEGLRLALLRWRFAKEWQRPEESLDCRGEDLGTDGGKRLLFGQAADRAWLDCVRCALIDAAIAPWSLNAASAYRFNCFHDRFAGAGGALLSLDTHYWTLQLWDRPGRVRRVLTRLRKGDATGDEARGIADEVERSILAYAQAGAVDTVEKLWLAGSAADTELLASALQGRVRDQVMALHLDEQVSGVIAGMKEGLGPLALAAAALST